MTTAGVGAVECFLKDLLNETRGAALGRHIESLEDGKPTVERDGKVFTRVDKTPKTVMSLFGPVTYVRHRYRRAASPSVVPVDEAVSLMINYFTEPAGKLAVFLYSQLPAAGCREICQRVGGMTLTQSTLQHLAGGMADAREEIDDEALDDIRATEGLPEGAATTCVSLDGARDNWGWLDGITHLTLLDYWHACQHLAKARDAIGDKGEAWYRRYKRLLRDDLQGVDKVLRSLRHYRKAATIAAHAETLREVITYVENNRHRMDYRRWRDPKRPIGSGVVEAANKTLVTRRMKLSSQRWNHDGGQAVLTWRALHHSRRFDAAWQHVMRQLNPQPRKPAANDNATPCCHAA